MSEATHKLIGTLPVLPTDDIEATLAYYTKTLEFTELFRQPGENGQMLNAQVAFSGCQLMFNRNPDDADKRGGGITLWFRLHDEDIDAYYKRIVERGAQVLETIADQFWGDRSFVIRDHAGYKLAFNKAIEGAKQWTPES